RTVYRRIVGENPKDLEDPVCLANLPETLKIAIANATQKNPAIEASLLLEKAAEAGIDFAQSNLFPSLNLQASLAHTEEQLFRDSETDIANATLRLTIPLYQGGGEYSRIRKAKELKNQRLMEGRDTKRLIEENTVRVWESLETSLANIKSFESQVTAMEKSLSGVHAEEEEGLRTILDVLDAERELLDAQVNLETANRNAFIAAFDLRAMTGTLTAQALKLPVNVYNIREQY
ncbi:MAG: TolC family protein, partial [Alphaproteobacteria bacterium]|nr:TolC family protein [Alphaproteobacteria bacterium]